MFEKWELYRVRVEVTGAAVAASIAEAQDVDKIKRMRGSREEGTWNKFREENSLHLI